MNNGKMGSKGAPYITLKEGRISFGLVTLSFVTIVALCLIVLFYIIQVNEIVNQSYLKAEKEQEIREIKEENDKLRAAIAESRAIHKVEEGGERLNLQKADPSTIKYVQVRRDFIVDSTVVEVD